MSFTTFKHFLVAIRNDSMFDILQSVNIVLKFLKVIHKYVSETMVFIKFEV